MFYELKSKSFLLDCERKKRSFQNIENPIKDIFRKVIKEDNKAKYFDAASKGALQKEVMIQYDETDWEFIKRIASKLKVKLITNIRDTVPNIAIGIQRGNDYTSDIHNYILNVDIKDYLKSHINFGNWTLKQKTGFCIESINNYFLYDNILYDNTLFTIVKKKISYKRGILLFTYWIKEKAGVRQDFIINEKIQGVSIDGIVLDTLRDRVRLHLSIDKEQNSKEAFWYKCETPYTAERNTGFYTMPQKGNSVKLIFPKGSAEDGFVRTVNRKYEKNNFKTANPNTKYFGNIYEKKIIFDTSKLQLTANGKIYVNMDNNDGIKITSGENIHIHSDSKARTLGKEIYFRAGEEIHIATRAGSILIDEEVNIKAKDGVSGV